MAGCLDGDCLAGRCPSVVPFPNGDSLNRIAPFPRRFCGSILNGHLVGHKNLRAATSTIKCSTPSGITAIPTRALTDTQKDDTRVCSTPSGITAIPACSASPRRCAAASGAQRLPASWRFPQRRLVRGLALRLVLNAFRHHGDSHVGSQHPLAILTGQCSTPSGITAGQGHCLHVSHHVLNAFRHHGDSHSAVSAARVSRCRCSTPSGITAIPTSWPCQHAHDRGVLNAFRHHGDSHTDTEAKKFSRDKCSTPSGITASPTRKLNRKPRWGLTMCSTPSGITAIPTVREVTDSTRATRTQRLPASRRFPHISRQSV